MASETFSAEFWVGDNRAFAYYEFNGISSAILSVVYNGVEIFIDERERGKYSSCRLSCANKYMTDNIYIYIWGVSAETPYATLKTKGTICPRDIEVDYRFEEL